MNISFILNQKPESIEIENTDTPLLWVIRDILGLTGTKFGCGKAACGACTIHVDGKQVRSCSFAVKHAVGKHITTIEGLGTPNKPHPIQTAWMEFGVPQCGYCQPGFIMAASALLNYIPNPTDEDIENNIVNICRCGTYTRMRNAIKSAAQSNSN